MRATRARGQLPPVRVRHEPPNVEEAVAAAQGLSDDVEQQVEIAAGLMGVAHDEVRPFIAARRRSPLSFERRPPADPGGPRVVILKRRPAARLSAPSASK